MSVITNNLLLGEDGYNISRSVRLRSSASAYFSRTPASAGNRTTWTWSAWVKRGALGSSQSLFEANSGNAYNRTYFYFKSDDTLTFNDYGSSSTNGTFNTTQVFRDVSAWYHIVLVFDTSNATSTDRIRLYVNGNRVTTFSSSTMPSSSYAGYTNTTIQHLLGSEGYAGSYQYLDGYLTEINFIDGQALTASSFGETDLITGVWKPKKYTGTYGTNGFFLNFSDNSNNTAATIGKDSSGNGNNWTPNNISVTSGVTYDSMLDVPTMWADGGNGRGNYAVLNPLRTNGSVALSASLAQGNLYFKSSSQYKTSIANIGMSTGKWYFEAQMTNAGGVGDSNTVGIEIEGNPAANHYIGYDPNAVTTGYGYNHFSGNLYGGTAGGNDQTGGATWTTGDIIGVSYDADAGQAKWYKNNTLIYTKSGLSGTWFFAVSGYDSSQSNSFIYVNFGQRPFTYTPPTGFKALNTQNLPDATIKKGNQYFDATTYTGNGSTQSIVNSGSMQPDLVWAKTRSTATHGALVDSVRGVDKYLYSSLTIAEETQTTALSSFNSNGFSLAGSFGNVNANGTTYVAWQWKESVSAGFDIVTYTGTGVARTVSHSLGVTPSMIIVKDRTTGGTSWQVYHRSLGNTDAVLLNSTGATFASSSYWNNTSPTSSVFTVGTSSFANTSAENYVAYLFAEVAGYSKFGSYTGNGSSDGPFVYLGFRPRFIMTKSSSGVENWLMYDTARDTYNPESNYLKANASDAEASFVSYDVTANGFKLRTTGGPNTSGGTYIYAAFAENPFKNSLAR